MNLGLVSTLTMWLLSLFVFIIIFFVNFFGWIEISLITIIIVIIVFNTLLWLISPIFSDLIYKWLYKVQWLKLEDIAKDSPKTSELINKICNENNISLPKFWMIPDENPTAFTYWSWKWNARIIISRWIITYLIDEERAAVYAHEFGHIKNNDFIIMTIASTLLQILYEIYVAFAKNSKWGNNKNKEKLAIIWLISYAFYFVWQYVLLYLSRVREYFADEFWAKYADPNRLSDALIKIAYWILVTPTNNRLVESTKFIWIANDAMSKWIWMLYYNTWKDDSNELIEKSFLYDIKNPWAMISELTSTHPLTWKRISRLMTLTQTPKYDIKAIEQKYPVDRVKLYSWFGMDLTFLLSTTILPFILAIVSLFIFYDKDYIIAMVFSSFLIWLGISTLIKTFWAYPTNDNKEATTVLDLMSDVYASPVKWKKVMLNGTIIWKWDPWYIFSEDVMLKDSTWLMHLDYQSKIPLIGNLIFSLTKVKKFLWKSVTTTWWFFRWVSHYTVVEELFTSDRSLKASWWIKFWWVVMWFVFIAIWSWLWLLFIG